jgi:hypothetical protein
MTKRTSGQEGTLLPIVNRSALVLEPAQAYLEWAKGCPEAIPDLTFKELGEEGTVYLIPETNNEPDSWLRRNFVALFEYELNAWIWTGTSGPKTGLSNPSRSFSRCGFALWCWTLERGHLRRIESPRSSLDVSISRSYLSFFLLR